MQIIAEPHNDNTDLESLKNAKLMKFVLYIGF